MKQLVVISTKLKHGTYTSEGTMNHGLGHTKNIYCKSSDCPLCLSSLHAYKLLLRYFEIHQEPRFFPFYFNVLLAKCWHFILVSSYKCYYYYYDCHHHHHHYY